MSYITAEEFKARFFPESKFPSLQTLRRQLEGGRLKGRKIGKRWFVDVIAFEANGNALVEKILR